MRVERLRKTLRNLDYEATYIPTDDSEPESFSGVPEQRAKTHLI